MASDEAEDKPAFPIHGLNDQAYCEYKIFLEYAKGVEVEPTQEMIEGREEHDRLYSEFEAEAIPTTFVEAVELSKTKLLSIREFLVYSQQCGIIGRIDEIEFTPEAFIVIDDKRGPEAYLSDRHQVYGYCLAFKETVKSFDSRPIFAALRDERTGRIYWNKPFDTKAERKITQAISRVHGLVSGQEEYTSNKNPNKCRGCRFKEVCDRSVV